VKFKIGHYFDEVLCDIMPMDCCHILLGRPWQYDRYAIHDGRMNQYTLWVNGKKHILLPLIESIDEVNCTTCENFPSQWETIWKGNEKEKKFVLL